MKKIQITENWLKLDVGCGILTVIKGKDRNIQLQMDSDDTGDSYVNLSKYEAKQISNMLLVSIGEFPETLLNNKASNKSLQEHAEEYKNIVCPPEKDFGWAHEKISLLLNSYIPNAYMSGSVSFALEAALLRDTLRNLLETTEELATIVHLITSKQGEAIEKAKVALKIGD